MTHNTPWLDWAVELQSLAQAGLFYTRDPFDRERFERIRTIAAEMLTYQTGLPPEKVRDLFCCETGYQTPKLDSRAAVFQDEKILLVQEKNGTWSLPGGWVDVTLSVGESTVKEVWEEAGLRVQPRLVIAVQDRERHNQPVYAYKICKIFLLCTLLGAPSGKIQRPSPAAGFLWTACRPWRRRKIPPPRSPSVSRPAERTTGSPDLIRKRRAGPTDRPSFCLSIFTWEWTASG